MTTLIEIRKAFEVRLKTALDAYAVSVAVDWPSGATFDPGAAILKAKPTMIFGPEIPRTLGPTPAVSRKGVFKVGLSLASRQPPDLLDDLAEAVKAAYPYGDDLTAGAGKIQIDQKAAGAPLPVDGWLYRAVDLTWSLNI